MFDLFLKIGNSLQAMFMLGPKPLSVYDQQLKHGLGYSNPYTLRQAISECPKLYVASRTGNIEIPLNVRDSEETLEDAFKKSFFEQNMSYILIFPLLRLLETKNNAKSSTCFYTSKEEIALNDFCRDQVKQLLNELLDYFDGFQNLFQRDIKEMKDAFKQNDVYLDEIEEENDLLKDQLLEASLKHDIETMSVVKPSPKTRFSKKATQSKTLDTTSVASKSKIDEASASKARDKADAIQIYILSPFQTWLLLHNLSNGQKQIQQVRVMASGKSKKASHSTKLIPSDYTKLELPSIFTWVYFLRSKDETPEIIKKFIAQAQLNYKAKVCKIRTDNGTEFKNATLKAYYEKLEAEYVSLSACCAQVIWMRTQLLDYGFKYNRILMYYDSKSAIAISCNPVQHSKTKHIDIQYHFIKEHVERGTVEIYFVRTEYQLADLFTKALPKERFEYLVHRIESKILMNIIKNHPLRFSIAASAFVPWIYMAQFWHTLKEDGSKHRLKFLLDRKELTLTLDDFRTIFHLPQANDNNQLSGLCGVHVEGAFTICLSSCHSFPYLCFTKIIISDYMTIISLDISRRARDVITIFSDDIMKISSIRARNKNKCHQQKKAGEDDFTRHDSTEEIEKLVEDPKNVDESSPPRHDDTSIPGTRLEPRSDKESPEVEIV
ncbi:retrovirus-related pol polyprotein from transposon TNT 1-94 [Tanacetum coccineum]